MGGPGQSTQALRETLRSSTDPRTQRTRADILGAVERLSANGTELSVSAISRASGVSRATFYSHYEGLDGLAAGLLTEAMQSIGDLYRVDHATSDEALRLSQERLVAHFSDNRALYRAVASLPVSKEHYLVAVRKMAGIIEETLAGPAGIPNGLKSGATARYIASAAFGLLDAWTSGEVELTESELVEHLFQLLPTWFGTDS